MGLFDLFKKTEPQPSGENYIKIERMKTVRFPPLVKVLQIGLKQGKNMVQKQMVVLCV